jgi:hypothetical protein
VRESDKGFVDGTEFNPLEFYADPVEPRLCDLLTKAECEHYRRVPPRARASVMVRQ